jgi:hypothetical protein
MLELNCFVQRDDASEVFSVEIPNSKLISALRDAIKDKNPSSFHDDFEDSVNKLELEDDEELSPV